MRIAILLTCGLLCSAAAAQPGARSLAERPWRIAASGGVHAYFGVALSASAERRVLGPLAVGGRAGAYSRTAALPLDDGGAQSGATGEGHLALTLGGRWIRLRGVAGLGAGVLEGYESGLVFEDEPGCCGGGSFSGLHAYPIVGLGVDVSVTPSVALGVEYRVDPSDGGANASALDVGLRLHF